MKKYLITITIIISANLFCQPVNAGLKYEPFYLFANINNESKCISSPNSIYILLGMKIDEKLTLEIQSGMILVENIYGGAEIGIASKYYFLMNSYATAGVISNFQIANLTDSKGFDKIHYIGNLGCGTYLNENIFIQAVYQFPIAKNLIDETVITNPYDPNLNKHIKSKMNGMLKLAIGFTFDL